MTYIEDEQIIAVGSNSPERNKCQLTLYKLINDQGIIGLEELKTFDFTGLMMDLKNINFFGMNNFVVIAINSYILIFELDLAEESILIKRHKIINQIAVYQIKLRKVGGRDDKVNGVEILIADIMKSMSVYFVAWDQNHVWSSRMSYLKYRFPFGQWCTALEKV